MHFVWGLIGIAIGTMLIWKTYPLVNTFGRIDWAERHLGSGMGGTYLLYKIAGMVIVLFSAMYMFGLEGVLIAPLRSVFGGR